jgi:hypothetical protein
MADFRAIPRPVPKVCQKRHSSKMENKSHQRISCTFLRFQIFCIKISARHYNCYLPLLPPLLLPSKVNLAEILRESSGSLNSLSKRKPALHRDLSLLVLCGNAAVLSGKSLWCFRRIKCPHNCRTMDSQNLMELMQIKMEHHLLSDRETNEVALWLALQAKMS